MRDPLAGLLPAVLASIAAIGGCSASSSGAIFDGQGGAGGGASAASTAVTSSTTTSDASSGIGGGFLAGVGGGGGASVELVAEVFGNSPDVLYKLDPETHEVTTIGPFQGCSSVIDIALDKDSNLFGTTFGGLYKIDKETAACSLIAQGNYPNSLSFVPEGTLDHDEEALVGYVGATYERIDTVTGAVTPIGNLPNGYASSGDIVSVKNGKTLLTITGPGCGDCLAEVDPVTGMLVTNWGPIGYGAVFGIAFWAGSAFGFDDAGDLFEMKLDGGVLTTSNIPIPGDPTLEFWGAGSTTSAPPSSIPE